VAGDALGHLAIARLAGGQVAPQGRIRLGQLFRQAALAAARPSGYQDYF